jgi:hypothetical protein
VTGQQANHRPSPPHPEVRAERASKERTRAARDEKQGSKNEEALALDEFASPACSAHEMDPAYMWAERRVGWLARALSFLRSRRLRR